MSSDQKYFDTGVKFYNNEELDNALDNFEKCSKINPKNIDVLIISPKFF